jgi:hypothetical protein
MEVMEPSDAFPDVVLMDLVVVFDFEIDFDVAVGVLNHGCENGRAQDLDGKDAKRGGTLSSRGPHSAYNEAHTIRAQC